MPAVLHALLGKSSYAVLLPESMVKILPQRVCSVNWFLPALTPCTAPVKKPNWGCDGTVAGNSEMVTPLETPRFTERSDCTTVFRWKSINNPRGELAPTVSGKGAD